MKQPGFWKKYGVPAGIAAVLLIIVVLFAQSRELEQPEPVVVKVEVTMTPVPEAGSTQIREKDGMAMVYVPAGAFLMGSQSGDPNADDDEFPQHEVYLNAFWIDQYEVTNARYRMCVQDNKCALPDNTKFYDDKQYADHPVVYVDWYDARDYCAWAGGRLPTEAEWEKAARGTDGRTYPWGEQSPNPDLLNYDGNIGNTTAVGSYPAGASPYGALDMAGNVWEWTSSLYQDYPYDSKDGRENPEASGSRVLRGGFRNNSMRSVRAANRSWSNPDYTLSQLGFRCVASQ